MELAKPKKLNLRKKNSQELLNEIQELIYNGDLSTAQDLLYSITEFEYCWVDYYSCKVRHLYDAEKYEFLDEAINDLFHPVFDEVRQNLHRTLVELAENNEFEKLENFLKIISPIIDRMDDYKKAIIMIFQLIIDFKTNSGRDCNRILMEIESISIYNFPDFFYVHNYTIRLSEYFHTDRRLSHYLLDCCQYLHLRHLMTK